MGNTTIQTQSFRAVESGQSKRYIIPFACCAPYFFFGLSPIISMIFYYRSFNRPLP
jgi:hypothetical protein